MSEYTTTHTVAAPGDVKRLERSRNRLVAGVAAGLGRYFDLNPAFFRIGFVVLTLLGGAGILVYVAAVLVIPDEAKPESIAEEALRRRRERPWPVIGLGIAGVALLVLLTRATLWPVAGAGWTLLLVGGLVILWAFRAENADRRVRMLVRTLVTVSALAIAAVIAAVAIAFTWFDVSLSDGIGDRTAAPATIAQVQPVYALGIGDLRVDLSSLAAPATVTHVRVKVGIGEARIVVPPGASVTAHTKLGVIHAFGRRISGSNDRYVSPQGGKLVIDATVGAGRIDLVRAVR